MRRRALRPPAARRAVLGVAAAAVLVVLTPACGDDDGRGADAAGAGSSTPTVVVTTSILGDVVAQVAGDDAGVRVLIGSGVDPHDVQASARDAQALRDAALIVANGGGLEGQLLDAIEAAADDGVPVFELLPHARPLAFADEDHDDGHGHGGFDPHVWQDPTRVADALGPLAAALEQVIPGGGFTDRAERYAEELRAQDAATAAQLASIPADRRLLVTTHEAFGYFADRYGFEVVGVLVEGGATVAGTSARQLARLAEAVTTHRVPAVFTEESASRALAESLAREVGGGVAVVPLYSDALGGPGSDAATYLDLLRTNAARVADALA